MLRHVVYEGVIVQPELVAEITYLTWTADGLTAGVIPKAAVADVMGIPQPIYFADPRRAGRGNCAVASAVKMRDGFSLKIFALWPSDRRIRARAAACFRWRRSRTEWIEARRPKSAGWKLGQKDLARWLQLWLESHAQNFATRVCWRVCQLFKV